MSRFARHKDTAHRPTVIALRAAGASVQALDIKDGPDLLVGFDKHTILMEVKTLATNTKKDGYTRKVEGQLSQGQRAWHDGWKGGPVVTVFGPEVALHELGLEMPAISRLKALTSNWTKDVTSKPRAPTKARPFRHGTDKARSLAETCKADFCTTSAVPGTKPPRCAAHAAEETFAPIAIKGVDFGRDPARVLMHLGDRTVDVTGRTNEEMAEVAARLINEAAES